MPTYSATGGGGSGSSLVYDVTDYGAVGDGVADDAPAIQAAIDAAAAAGGGTVYFPVGIYLIKSRLSISTNGVSLAGVYVGSSIIRVATDFDWATIPANGGVVHFHTGVADFSVEKLTIDGNGVNPTSLGVGLLGLHTASRFLVRQVRVDGGGAGTDSTAIFCSAAQGGTFIDVRVLEAWKGFYMDGTSKMVWMGGGFTNNELYNVQVVGSSSDLAVIGSNVDETTGATPGSVRINSTDPDGIMAFYNVPSFAAGSSYAYRLDAGVLLLNGCEVGPWSTNTNSGGVDIAAGAKLVASGCRFYSSGTASGILNAGTVIDGGGNTVDTLSGAGTVGFELLDRQTYSASNVVTDRAYDADATTVAELADVLGTLIADLRAKGVVS